MCAKKKTMEIARCWEEKRVIEEILSKKELRVHQPPIAAKDTGSK